MASLVFKLQQKAQERERQAPREDTIYHLHVLPSMLSLVGTLSFWRLEIQSSSFWDLLRLGQRCNRTEFMRSMKVDTRGRYYKVVACVYSHLISPYFPQSKDETQLGHCSSQTPWSSLADDGLYIAQCGEEEEAQWGIHTARHQLKDISRRMNTGLMQE
ncbi:hypothetical protein O3P69_003793 [Scylla paramamosain]|uniref:Uncharacterized protein n=1 Tax=Scylla paramamosain TaxID=85552 RepID=A0AAW0UHD6_SCYPA